MMKKRKMKKMTKKELLKMYNIDKEAAYMIVVFVIVVYDFHLYINFFLYPS